MALKVTVACPNCACTGTFQVGVTSGSSPAYCYSCKKGFRIYMSQGNVRAVKPK